MICSRTVRRSLKAARKDASIDRRQSVIHLALEEIVSRQGLGIPHYVVLTLLAESPGLPNAELARKAFVTP